MLGSSGRTSAFVPSSIDPNIAPGSNRSSGRADSAAIKRLTSTVNANNSERLDEYLADVAEAVQTARDNPELASEGNAAMYGMMGTLPNRGDLKTLVLDLLDQMFTVESKEA